MIERSFEAYIELENIRKESIEYNDIKKAYVTGFAHANIFYKIRSKTFENCAENIIDEIDLRRFDGKGK